MSQPRATNKYYWDGNVELAMKAEKLLFQDIDVNKLNGLDQVFRNNRLLYAVSIKFLPIEITQYIFSLLRLARITKISLYHILPELLPSLPDLRYLHLYYLDDVPNFEIIFSKNNIKNLKVDFTEYRPNQDYIDFRLYPGLERLKINSIPLFAENLSQLICESPIRPETGYHPFLNCLERNKELFKISIERFDFNKKESVRFMKLINTLELLESLEIRSGAFMDIDSIVSLPIKELKLSVPLSGSQVAKLSHTLISLRIIVEDDAVSRLYLLPPKLKILGISRDYYETPIILPINNLPLLSVDSLEINSDFDLKTFLDQSWGNSKLRKLTLSMNNLGDNLRFIFRALYPTPNLEELMFIEGSLSLPVILALSFFIRYYKPLKEVHIINPIHVSYNELYRISEALKDNQNIRKFLFISRLSPDIDLFLPIIQNRQIPIEISFSLTNEYEKVIKAGSSIIKYEQ